MNVNSPLKVPAIDSWVKEATQRLKDIGINSARLDSEIILAHTIHKPRTYLHAHPEEQLERRDIEIADARLALRLDFVPIAYIIGHKEFYGRSFNVTNATLIPRPESETMIDLLKQYCQKQPEIHLIDVGTGSGCIGITAKLELPYLDVTLSDISQHALNIASKNSKALVADVRILLSDLLESYDFTPDIILSNLPYVDPSWEVSPETRHEPDLALFAQNEGLSLILKLIQQARFRLPTNGQLYLEADIRQHEKLIEVAKTYSFDLMKQQGYILAFKKIA